MITAGNVKEYENNICRTDDGSGCPKGALGQMDGDWRIICLCSVAVTSSHLRFSTGVLSHDICGSTKWTLLLQREQSLSPRIFASVCQTQSINTLLDLYQSPSNLTTMAATRISTLDVSDGSHVLTLTVPDLCQVYIRRSPTHPSAYPLRSQSPETTHLRADR